MYLSDKSKKSLLCESVHRASQEFYCLNVPALQLALQVCAFQELYRCDTSPEYNKHLMDRRDVLTGEHILIANMSYSTEL